MDAFRSVFPQCRFTPHIQNTFGIIRHKPDGERKIYRVIVLSTEDDDFDWVKGCTMAYMGRYVLTGKLYMPEEEAPQCLVFHH